MTMLLPRDLRLLELLSRYEVMSSRQIQKTIFPGIAETNFFRRLRKLEKAKFIKRLGPMLDHSYAWLLDYKGKALLGFEEIEQYKNRLTLEHDVAVTQVRMTLDQFGIVKSFTTESTLRQQAKERNTKAWNPEKSIVVPDGLFTADIKGNLQVIALEVELSFKNRHRYFDLFRRYHEYHGGVFAIWYFVKSQSLGDRIQSLWKEFHEKNPRFFKKIFLFQSDLESFTQEPVTATLRVENQTVKISDLWPSIRNFEIKIHDHTLDQSVINSNNEISVGHKCA